MQSKCTVSFLPKTKLDLSHEYGISAQTITKWCRKIGIDTKELLTIKQVKLFYKHYDYPEKNVNVREDKKSLSN